MRLKVTGSGADWNARSHPAILATVTPLPLPINVDAVRVDLGGAPGSTLGVSFGGAEVEDFSVVLERQFAKLGEVRSAVGLDSEAGLLLGEACRGADRQKDDQTSRQHFRLCFTICFSHYELSILTREEMTTKS